MCPEFLLALSCLEKQGLSRIAYRRHLVEIPNLIQNFSHRK